MLLWIYPLDPHQGTLPLALHGWSLLSREKLREGSVCHDGPDRAGPRCWSSIQMCQQGLTPNFTSEGMAKMQWGVKESVFRAVKIQISPFNVGFEGTAPRKAPWKEQLQALFGENNSKTAWDLANWKGQIKYRSPWEHGCSMVHAERGLCLFPVQDIFLAPTLTALQGATTNNNTGNALLKAAKILISHC